MPAQAWLPLILLTSATVLAQSTPPPRAEFEVASVRPSSPAGSTGGVRIDGAQVHFGGLTLREYIARASGVRVAQVMGPDWMAATRFDVDATLPEGTKANQVPDMLAALLRDRFALKQHREQREMATYALVLNKPPLKLRESAPDPNPSNRPEVPVNVTVAAGAAGVAVDLGHGASYTFAGGKFAGTRMTAKMIADTLERFADRPVLDMTGLAGTYDVAFEMTPEDSQAFGLRAAVNAGVALPPQVLKLLDAAGDPLPGAVEQLGLRLDPRKLPIDVVIVDEIRRSPIDN